MTPRALALEALNVPPCNRDDPTNVLCAVGRSTASELRVLCDALDRNPELIDVLDGLGRRLDVAIQIAEEMQREDRERRDRGVPVVFDTSEAAQ